MADSRSPTPEPSAKRPRTSSNVVVERPPPTARQQARQDAGDRAQAEAKEAVRAAAIGGGGCTAHALVNLAVFKDVRTAKRKLNARIDQVHRKRVKETGNEEYPHELVGIEDDVWCHEVVKLGVTKAGFHFKKVRLDDDGGIDLGGEKWTLARVLEEGCSSEVGGFLLDGVLNKVWYYDGKRMENDGEDPTDPVSNEAAWRHAVAVVDGEIREQLGQAFPLRCLWLGRGNQPDTRRGYMRKLLKVYHVTRCLAPAGSKCTGECYSE